MEVTKKDLIAKARGFTVSIEKMSDNQRVQIPSGQYAEDYNRLRKLAAEAYPHLNSLLPPAVELYQGGGGSAFYSEQSFGEIHTYCEHLFQLLSEQL